MSRFSLLIKSEYGDQVALVTSGTEQGAIAQLTMEHSILGGAQSLKFYLKQGCDIPLYAGMNVYLQLDGSLLWGFDIDGSPFNRGTDGQVEVNCLGFAERLKKGYVTTSLANVTVEEALLSVASEVAATGLSLSLVHSELPTDHLTLLEVEDQTLYDFIDTLVTYANGAVGVDKYTWIVDVDKAIKIIDTSLVPLTSYYEGFDFQAPRDDVNRTDQVNVIHLWHTTETNAKEFVATFTDQPSIDQFGRLEKRIELDYSIVYADAYRLCKGIFSRYATPARTVAISSLIGVPSYGTHRLFLKPILSWTRLYAGEDKGALDLSHSTGVTFSDDESSLIGRYSTKAVLNASGFGYISLPVTPAILIPKKVRLFLKGSVAAKLRVVLVDKDGDSVEASLICDGSWMQFTIAINDVERNRYAVYLKSPDKLHDMGTFDIATVYMRKEDAGAEGQFGLFSRTNSGTIFDTALQAEYDYAVGLKDKEGEWRDVYLSTRDSISSLAAVQIHFDTPTATYWLDHVDCFVKQWQTEELPYSKASLSVVNNELLASAQFGNGERTTSDELTELWAVLRSKK